jgi:peptide/nickel transport system substrate-binding protein
MIEGEMMANRLSARVRSAVCGLALVTGAGALAACASPAGTTSATGGGRAVTVALSSDPDALDPTLSATVTGRAVLVNMCEGLFEINDQAQVVPRLATALPTVSADGRALTIKLRQGVTFNDGTPFNAAAVVTTLQRDKTLKTSARVGDLASMESVKAVDDSTVELSLSRPDAGLVGQLSDRAGQIVSPAQLEKLGDDFGKNPVCVGPFSFVSRNPGSNIVLEKSTHYYDAAAVKLDKVTFNIVADDNIRATQLRAGTVQVADRIPTNSVAQLKSDQAVTIAQNTSLGFWGIAVNVGNQGAGKPFAPVDRPLANLAVRQALELSLDRASITHVVYNDLFKPDCAPLSPASPYATPPTCPQRDVAKAKQLLANAGVATPVKLTLRSDNNTQTQQLDQILQSQAKEAGFDIKIETSDITSLIADEKSGDYDAFILQWSGRVDPDANIRAFNATTGSLNYTGASTPEVDTLLGQGVGTADVAARKPIYDQVTKALQARLNIIYLFHDVYLDGVSAKLTGFQMFSDGLPRLKTATLS